MDSSPTAGADPASADPGTAGTDPRATADLRTTADPLLAIAIERFAHEGSRATLRAIARDAGVSAALLVKRYGSKESLRRACDDVVLARITRTKETSIRAASQHRLMWGLPEDEDQAVLLGYVMHAVLEGGGAGHVFMEHMVEDAERYMGDAVAAGVVRPSRDERARAKYLVMSGVGALMVSLVLADEDAGETPSDTAAGPGAGSGTGPDRPTPDLRSLLARAQQEVSLPMLELCSEALFTDDSILREYGEHLRAQARCGTPGSGTRQEGR